MHRYTHLLTYTHMLQTPHDKLLICTLLPLCDRKTTVVYTSQTLMLMLQTSSTKSAAPFIKRSTCMQYLLNSWLPTKIPCWRCCMFIREWSQLVQILASAISVSVVLTTILVSPFFVASHWLGQWIYINSLQQLSVAGVSGSRLSVRSSEGMWSPYVTLK